MTWCANPSLARPEWALNETVVEGTSGSLSVQVDGSLRFVSLRGKTEVKPVPMPPDDQVYLQGFLATQTHFIDGLRNDTPHETSGADTLKTMEVIWAAYRSAEEERTLTV
jgi:predicted dehydrogenase